MGGCVALRRFSLFLAINFESLRRPNPNMLRGALDYGGIYTCIPVVARCRAHVELEGRTHRVALDGEIFGIAAQPPSQPSLLPCLVLYFDEVGTAKGRRSQLLPVVPLPPPVRWCSSLRLLRVLA